MDQNILDTPINPTGEGEPEVIKDFLDPKYPELPPAETVPILLALQKLIEGQDSMQAKIDARDDQVQKQLTELYTRLDERDKATQAFQENQKKFVEDAIEGAKSLQINDPAERAKIQAQSRVDLQQRTTAARAHRKLGAVEMKARIMAEPKEMVTSMGEHVLTRGQGGGIQSKILPEKITIGDFYYIFPIGRPVEVPRSVAEALRNKKMDEADGQDLKNLLAGGRKKDEEIVKSFPGFPVRSDA